MTNHEIYQSMRAAEGIYQIAMANVAHAQRTLTAAAHNLTDAADLYMERCRAWQAVVQPSPAAPAPNAITE